MFNKKDAIECFSGLIGFRESADKDCYEALTSALKKSYSGVYVNEGNAPLTLGLINQAIGGDENSVNEYLTNAMHSETLEMLSAFVILQKKKLYTKELLANFDIGVRPNAGNIRLTIAPNGRFVGIEIEPFRGNSVRVDVASLGIHFDTVVTDFPIYFYNSSQLDPVVIVLVTTTKAGSLEWIIEDNLNQGSGSTAIDFDRFVSEFVSKNYATGSRSFIGYYEDDLAGAKAIDTHLISSCLGCTGRSLMHDVRPYVNVKPFQFMGGNTYMDRTLPDIQNIGYTTETFGLSLKLNARCDITSVLCANKSMFAMLLKKFVAKRLLWDIVNSNQLSGDIVSQKAGARLTHDKLIMEIEKEMGAISIDFRHVDKICLPEERGFLQLANM